MKAPAPQGYLTKEGKQIYEEICKLLDKYGTIEEVDSFGLSMLADSLDSYQVAAKEVNENGPVQVYKTGATAPSAWMNVKKQSYEAFLKLSQRFGLSPKDRELMLKFKVKKKEEDALDEI